MLPFFHLKIKSPSSLSPSNNYHIALSQPNVWEEKPSIAGLTFSRPTHSSLTACHPAGTHLQSSSCHSRRRLQLSCPPHNIGLCVGSYVWSAHQPGTGAGAAVTEMKGRCDPSWGSMGQALLKILRFIYFHCSPLQVSLKCYLNLPILQVPFFFLIHNFSKQSPLHSRLQLLYIL